MNADKLLDAFSELEEGAVRSAGALLGFEEERMRTRRPFKIIIRAVLIAAILATLSIGAAYAMGLFTMEVRTPEEGEELVGHSVSYNPWTLEEEHEERDLTKSPLILQFTGEGEIHRVEFRPGWLPEAEEKSYFQIYGNNQAQNWYISYSCIPDRENGGAGTLYQIECHYAWPGCTVYMDGESARVVKEEDWGELHITEIEQQTYFKDENGASITHRFVLVFDSAAGWYISIGGTADFETLEHIARELEVRSLDELAENSTSDYYYLGVGIG